MAFRYDKPYRTLINIDNQKISELFNLVYQMDTQELMQYSLINKVPLSVQLPNGNNLIHEVLLNNDKLKNEFNKLNVIKFLVHNEVNPDEPNRDNQTPIHIACQKQYKEISDFLINECSVDLKYKDNNGFTALHYLLIGDISLFEKKETSDLISFQRKGDIVKKDEILEIKKLIYNKIKDEPFLLSLEKTIYDTLKNSSEINDTLLEIEDKINKRVKSTDTVNQLKENKELIEIQKNKMKGIIGGLWGKFADTPKLKLHTPTIDSLTIESDNIGIIENANLKKELKGEIDKNVDEFREYIDKILSDENNLEQIDKNTEIEEIYTNFIRDNSNIFTNLYGNKFYDINHIFEDEDLEKFTNINNEKLHENANDFADNIIDLENKVFIGGSRYLSNNDNDYNYTGIENLFKESSNNNLRFKKLFLYLVLDRFEDEITKITNDEEIITFIEDLKNRYGDYKVYDYLEEYINKIFLPEYATEIYCKYTNLCCYYNNDNLNNLSGEYDIGIMSFMSCLMYQRYSFEEFIANLSFFIMNQRNQVIANETSFLQEMFLKFIYPLNNYSLIAQIPDSDYKKIIEDTFEFISDSTKFDSFIKNLNILFNAGYLKIPEIMICDFIYFVKSFENYNLYKKYIFESNGYDNFVLESRIKVPSSFKNCNIDKLTSHEYAKNLYNVLLADIPPSFQGFFYLLLDTDIDIENNIDFNFKKFIESINLKLSYRGTLHQYINDDNFDDNYTSVNIDQRNHRLFLLETIINNNMKIVNLPLPFNYIHPVNGINKNLLDGPFFIYNKNQYRPPSKNSYKNLSRYQYARIFQILKLIFLEEEGKSFNILFSSIKQGKIIDISKYYLCYYYIFKVLATYQANILQDLEKEHISENIEVFNVLKLEEFLNKTNGSIFLYYYLFSKGKDIKIPKFSFYKVGADKFYYLDSPYELVIQPDKDIEDIIRNVRNKDYIPKVENVKIKDFHRYLKNLLLDKAIIENKQYYQTKSNYLPPSVESILDKFFEYNKIILFKSINKDTRNYINILDNIKKILEKTNLSVSNIESQKQFYLFQLIQEIIKDQSELYTNKAINKILEETKIKEIDTIKQFNDIGEFRNTNINFVIETDDFYDNYYIFKNKNILDECKFIIYPNEYSNTYTLKQMYCLKINQDLLKNLINADSDPYAIDEYGNSIISPLEKTYHHQSLENLRNNDIDLYRYNIPKNPFDNLKLENLNHITKIIKGSSYNDYIFNFVSSQYNEIKVILLANNRFGYNIINYLDTSFKTCFYIINEYLTDILWRYNDDYKHIDLQAIISITGNSERNIRLNYLFTKIRSLNIPESNQVIILNDYLEKINEQMKDLQQRRDKIFLEKTEKSQINMDNKLANVMKDLSNIIISKSKINSKKSNNNYNIYNARKDRIIKTYQKIDDSGVYLKCWDELFKNNKFVEESWNLDLIKILLKEQDLLKVNNLENNIKEYEIINKFYKQLELLSKIYFEGSNFTSNNKVKKFVFELLEHLTGSFICYNIEMLLRNLLMKYFVDTSVNSYVENAVDQFNDINYKINYLFESKNVIKNKSFKDILYKDLSKEFVRNSVDLFENYEDKQLFESKSIKEILNDLFNLLTVSEIVSIPSNSQFMQILNRDLTDYFDLFIQKLINNWLVVIENTFKFSINQYRINKCILELAKP